MIEENTLRLWLREYTDAVKRKHDWIGYVVAFVSLTATLMSANFVDGDYISAQTCRQFFYCIDAALFAITARFCWDAYTSYRSVATPEKLIELIRQNSVEEDMLTYLASELFRDENERRAFMDLTKKNRQRKIV